MITAAVWFIRERACDGIKVADLVRALGVGRRTPESRFCRRHGMSPSHWRRQQAKASTACGTPVYSATAPARFVHKSCQESP